MTRKPRALNRRAAIVAVSATGVGAWWAWPRLAQHFVGDFDFEPLDDPPGIRRIATGETSGMPIPFFGLESPDKQDQTIPEAAVRADLCNGLFDGPPPAGVVPIASFSDYNCPFCRVLTERLSNLEERSGGDIRITGHEWPRLGPTSISAARAALAAAMQEAYAAFHNRLKRGRFIATPEYLEILARDIGVDGDCLLSDMESKVVSDRLRNTEAVARIFGFIGTPALVVGRTVVVGTVSDGVIAALVEKERRHGPPPVCST